MKKTILIIFILLSGNFLFSQTKSGYPNSIAPVGIIKNISGSALLDIIQRQTFRFFWHYAHPVSGLARERDNKFHAKNYWNKLNEGLKELNPVKEHLVLKLVLLVEPGWEFFQQ